MRNDSFNDVTRKKQERGKKGVISWEGGRRDLWHCFFKNGSLYAKVWHFNGFIGIHRFKVTVALDLRDMAGLNK